MFFPIGEIFYNEIRKYKFYLAFENGFHCKDYITEKFWINGLKTGTVPVVWGASKVDILKVAPTNSFIHVDDFPTYQKLADYLSYLSKNETAYRKYLEWRNWVEKPELIETRLRKENNNNDIRSFCALCKMLIQDTKLRREGKPVKSRVVRSLQKWWWDAENYDCLHHQ